VQGVIDWNNNQTFLTPNLSSYQDWIADEGIVDNIFEHQLRTGLNLFSETVTGDTDSDGINNYYEPLTAN